EKSTNDQLEGTGNFLPDLSSNASFGYTNTEDLSDDETSYGSGGLSGDNTARTVGSEIKLNWTLFDGFRMFRTKSLLDRQRVLADVELKKKIEETTLSVITAYYNTVSSKEALDVAENMVSISEERLKRTGMKRDLGKAGKRNYYNALTSYNKDRASKEEAELALLQAKNDLNKRLAREPDTDFNVVDSIEIPDQREDENKYYELAMKGNKTLERLKFSIKVSEKSLQLKRSSFYPMLNAVAGYGYNSSETDYKAAGDPVTNERFQGNVGLNLTWDIFKGFSRIISVKNARLDLENREYSLKEYELELKSLLNNYYDQYTQYRNRVEYDRKAVESAEINLEISTDLYNMGRITGVEFREAQYSYASAKMQLTRTKVNLISALVNLQKLAGNITFADE
ncbi:MAG: TolC family protein, partial [Chitinivibrionales bacterium]